MDSLYVCTPTKPLARNEAKVEEDVGEAMISDFQRFLRVSRHGLQAPSKAA